MARRPTLSRIELRIMEALWTRGACSVREIHEALPGKGRPAYTSVQTMVYRLEKKRAVRCVKRISNANIFDAAITRDEAHTRAVRLASTSGIPPDDTISMTFKPTRSASACKRNEVCR